MYPIKYIAQQFAGMKQKGKKLLKDIELSRDKKDLRSQENV